MPSRPESKPYASIDIGTNTVLCLIAQSKKDAKGPALEVIEDHARLTRLGEGLSQNRDFLPQAMKRTFDALRWYRERILALAIPMEHVSILGTAGMRRGQNAPDFIERVQKELQLEIQIIDGEREAYLSFLAVYYGLRHCLDPQKNWIIMDIGGGSTELIYSRYDKQPDPKLCIEKALSLLLGSVWFTENFLKNNDPPTREDFSRMQLEIERVLDANTLPWLKKASSNQLVGIAGTITTLAAMDRKMKVYDPQIVHGSQLKKTAVEKLLQQMLSLPLSQRRLLPGLEPERADVILAGAAIALAVMEKSHCESLWVSDQGIRYGVLYERLLTKSAPR